MKPSHVERFLSSHGFRSVPSEERGIVMAKGATEVRLSDRGNGDTNVHFRDGRFEYVQSIQDAYALVGERLPCRN